MGLSFNTIQFHAERCDGCGECLLACARAKSGTDELAHSRIRILPAEIEPASFPGSAGPFELALCRQCADPKCTTECPAGALSKNATTGVIDWDGEKCVDCLLCTVGCAYAGIAYNPVTARVAKCDTCDGDPACVRACPHEALEWRTAAQIFNAVGEQEDLFVRGLAGCQGCNSELLIRHTLRRVGPECVVAAPPGCIPGMGTVGFNGVTGCKVPIFHPLLTNTASMLAGIKRQYTRVGRDVLMLALAGDGGAADAGFASLSGAAGRNDPMLFICVDNEGYMNTGMQASGVTPYGSWTSTTPVGESLHGERAEAKNLPVIMMQHNCSYVATASTGFMEDYYAKLDRAIAVAKTGMAYLHVFTPCPTGWRIPPEHISAVCRMQVRTNFVVLWEYAPDTGLRLTRPVDKPVAVEEYLKLIGKYKHLSPEQVAHIQHTVNEKVAYLQQMARHARKVEHA
ncbi:MAG TPA: thiamine pyrophosphate-dependent enzyme [Acetobacteraceae bacterium]|nr:thiamine pyrophosphate-dependent enzyme [Acetobacteraceae bacterium]